MFKKISVVTAILGFVVMVAGCNTVAGAGKDVEAGGKAVDKAATDTKNKM